jgi:hypothetical protein
MSSSGFKTIEKLIKDAGYSKANVEVVESL